MEIHTNINREVGNTHSNREVGNTHRVSEKMGKHTQ